MCPRTLRPAQGFRLSFLQRILYQNLRCLLLGHRKECQQKESLIKCCGSCFLDKRVQLGQASQGLSCGRFLAELVELARPPGVRSLWPQAQCLQDKSVKRTILFIPFHRVQKSVIQSLVSLVERTVPGGMAHSRVSGSAPILTALKTDLRSVHLRH